ncbi:MAG: SpoIIIAH-like family protein [Oscillospiraceae bacterium]|jgi:stage III sporulation protein AH|nr:SpoIIIAH-like family protein [Oscillospiraceae bacterium]
MKKPTITIGKKQIILSCLTLILGVAVYTNYALSKDSPKKEISPTTTEASIDDTVENYGDSEFVSSNATSDFFANARLEKVTNRDLAVETLQSIIGGGDLTQDEMVTNAINAVEVSKLVEKEGEIESLIKAQGFTDCVVYLSADSAKVVVKTDGLDPAGAASIKDIILGAVAVPTENIRIFELS